ncbi:MAG: nitroreductase [Burkholderiaceae bacterium]|nr:nitroreductase [Burkholderiaceae bacterium]
MSSTIDTITGRISPVKLTEPAPTAQQREILLQAACSAPDHGRLQPWRFTFIEGAARERLGDLMAASLQRREPQAAVDKLQAERAKALRAPLIVVAAAQIQVGKVPAVEQAVATGAAVQNMMLAAHALGLGAFWRTGAVVYDEAFKQAFGLSAQDTIVGIVYIGTIGAAGRARDAMNPSVHTNW